MNENITIGAVYADGTEKRAAARTAVTRKLPRVSFNFSASLPGDAPVSVRLYAGDSEVYASGVSADSGGLLGADISVALCAEAENAAEGADKLFGALSGTGDAVFGLDCEKADGTRETLASTAELTADGLTVTATVPAEARLVILTADGQDCATAEVPHSYADATDVSLCELTTVLHSSQIEVPAQEEEEGVSARILPVLLSSVRTFPDLPPARTLRAFGKVLVLYGMGIVCSSIDGAPVTVRAATDVTSVWAGADGTLAYVSHGRARMCRGSADLCETEGDKVIVTGTGDGAVMHVLGGGYVRGLSTSGEETYSRETPAVAISTFAGDVAELREEYTPLYSPTGEFISTNWLYYHIDSVPYSFDGGFGMVTSASPTSSALFLVTPLIAYKVDSDVPAGCDGLLIARTEADGRIGIYEYYRTSRKMFLGYADSAEFAFTDALYSVGEDGRISRRAALKQRVLYMGSKFKNSSEYTLTGTMGQYEEKEVAFSATGGKI